MSSQGGGVPLQLIVRIVNTEAGLQLDDVDLRSSLVTLGVGSFPMTRAVLALEELFDVELSAEDLVAATETPIAELGAFFQRAQSGSPTGTVWDGVDGEA